MKVLTTAMQPCSAWLALAATLCFALLLSLHDVVQSELEQGRLRRAIEATQVDEARACRLMSGGRAQEHCLKALTERARVSAATVPTECKWPCVARP